MIRYLRYLLGLNDNSSPAPADGEEGYGSDDSDPEEPAPLSRSSQRLPSNGPYYGNPVPLDANRELGDCTWYADFFQEICVAPHKDLMSLLVFPATFWSEDPINGKIKWTGTRDGEDWGRTRVETSIKIYEHLNVHGSSNSRIVKYLGKTTSGFRLERLSLGPMPSTFPAVQTNDNLLALYQRWALQVLSALVFFHNYGVVLNDLSASSLWLRSDYSVAVARIANAGSAELWVRGGFDRDGRSIENRWGPSLMQTEPPEPPEDAEAEAGRWQGDLFNWATMVYRFMTGDHDPLECGLPSDLRNNKEAYGEYMKRAHDVEAGRYDGFPLLDTVMLGSPISKAWKGEYESTTAALEDARYVLQSSGRHLSGDYMDDLVGFEWAEIFEVLRDVYGKNTELRLREGTSRGEDIMLNLPAGSHLPSPSKAQPSSAHRQHWAQHEPHSRSPVSHP